MPPKPMHPITVTITDISTRSVEDDDPAFQPCTSCTGFRKVAARPMVKGHKAKRALEASKFRWPQEKTFGMKCKDCKGSRKSDEGMGGSEEPGMGWNEDGASQEVEDEAVSNWFSEEATEAQAAEIDELSELLIAELEKEERAPTERSCSTCTEEKPIAEYGHILAENCHHTRDTCQDCLVHWIEAKIQESELDTITCPECPSSLGYAEISQILGPTSELFQR